MHLVLVPLLLAVGWTEGSLTDWTVSHLDEKSSAEHMHAEAVASLPSSFRLGSGASVVDKPTPNEGTLMEAELVELAHNTYSHSYNPFRANCHRQTNSFINFAHS